MSEIKVNKLTPRTNCGTVTLGDSGDTFTIPSGVTISNSGTAAGFGGTGEISWDTTVKTTGTFTATSGVGYFLNTTGGTITVNLPAGSAGSSVAFADYAGTWQNNKVTVSPNGSEKMGGVAADVDLSTEGQSVQFVYIDGTQGWINVIDSTSNVRAAEDLAATGGCITTCGDYKIHTFNSPGTFEVTAVSAAPANQTVSYMVVGGGGGGGVIRGGGGGAGGFREYRAPVSGCYAVSPLNGNPGGTAVTVTKTSYPIIVGGGGNGAVYSPYAAATNGVDSVFSTITSTGGGKGGSSEASPPNAGLFDGGPGGSGGGARNCGTIGNGNTPSVSPAQGKDGGSGAAAPNYGAGGGGGALCAGDPGSTGAGGNGGNGATTSITGSPVARAGGGGGAAYNTASVGPGGPGGGGSASPGSGTPYVGGAGTVNTGSGGGANSNLAPGIPGAGGAGGNGGSGVVIIRYKYQN